MKAICKMCNKEREILYYNLCNKCYRTNIMKIYNCHKLKKCYKSIDKIDNEKHRKVLRMVIWYNKPFEEISRVLEIPSRTIAWIINKYCVRCDKYGNPRPLEYCSRKKKKKY